MTCSRCGGRMESRRVTFCVCHGARPLMVENVPAHVCVQCHGEVFSADTVRVFERIRDGDAPVPRRRALEVYEFEAASTYKPVADGTKARLAAVLPGQFQPPLTQEQHHDLFSSGQRISAPLEAVTS